MADNQVKTIGILAVIAMITGAGGYWTATTGDKLYYCESTPSIEPIHCDRFSSTGNRCYPEAETTKGYKDCNGGWSLIVNDMESTNPPEEPLFNSKEIICSPPPEYGCREKTE